MNDEPEITELNGDTNEPATKGDVAELARMVAETTASRKDLATLATKEDLKEESEETRRQLLMAIEELEDKVLGANKDEISLIKDQKLPDHEQRIQKLEKKAGIPVGSTVQ